ncbi:MAG: Holliday junction branch migration protein RuvA [Christensenellaceae bacterium]|jgi:Holliday junction DNA helicase RuvA|nr:Holliday junction branch migration protein RuvA [Christensenellaceae bacterium]
MFAYLNGKVAELSTDSLVLDVGGVGFQLFCTVAALQEAKMGETLKLRTRLNIREDNWEIFGFLTREELMMFDKLVAVSGVGPKTAMGLLSAIGVQDLALAVVTGDVKTIRRAPGIGLKTAQRLLLELKDKVSDEELVGFSPAGERAVPLAAPGPVQDAIEGLMGFGYSSAEAAAAVAAVNAEDAPAPELIRLALRSMARMK